MRVSVPATIRGARAPAQRTRAQRKQPHGLWVRFALAACPEGACRTRSPLAGCCPMRALQSAALQLRGAPAGRSRAEAIGPQLTAVGRALEDPDRARCGPSASRADRLLQGCLQPVSFGSGATAEGETGHTGSDMGAVRNNLITGRSRSVDRALPENGCFCQR